MIIEKAIDVLKTEAKGILDLVDRVDDRFASMVETICASSGRVVVGGIGKSGIIGRKIVATLNSTGTRSIFIHPVEAMHGDLGMVSRADVFLALSNSGETQELNMLIPNIRVIGCPVIAFTGKTGSTLARLADIVIDVGVEKEACPMGLAPTTSTTALLAMGDALAVALMHKKKFNSDEFAKFHPGGSLGQRLSSRVRDIMITGNAIPRATLGDDMQAALRELDRVSIGALLILDAENRLAGIITDGDVRRFVARNGSIRGCSLDSVMTKSPLSVGPDTPAYDALNIMEQREITILPIVGEDRRVEGVLHLHDILGKGEFKFNGTLLPRSVAG